MPKVPGFYALFHNYIGLLAVFGSSLVVMILTMDINRTTMLVFFGIVTVASGLLMLVLVPQIREREEFYEGDVEHQLSFDNFLNTTIELLKERAFLLFFLTFFFFQSLVNNYLLEYTYFYDNLVLSKGFWTGLPDILIGIMAAILFPNVFKWIQRCGTKKVLFRMMLVSLMGYLLLTITPGPLGDELNTVILFGALEIPGEASYWLTTLMYFAIYFGFVGVFMTNTPIQRRLIDHLEL
jgi:Na+/melibiose symporter-like transporter